MGDGRSCAAPRGVPRSALPHRLPRVAAPVAAPPVVRCPTPPPARNACHWRGAPSRHGGALMTELGYAHPPLPQGPAIIQPALHEGVSVGDDTTDNNIPEDQQSGA